MAEDNLEGLCPPVEPKLALEQTLPAPDLKAKVHLPALNPSSAKPSTPRGNLPPPSKAGIGLQDEFQTVSRPLWWTKIAPIRGTLCQSLVTLAVP